MIEPGLLVRAYREGLFPMALDDGDIAVLAIQAGSDILLDPPDLDAAVSGIRSALAGGELTRERLEQSVTRILEWKVERGIWAGGQQPGLDVVGSEEHRAVATAIAERAATLLRDEEALSLPLDTTDRLLVVGAGSAWPERLTPLLAEEGYAVTERLEGGPSPSAGYRAAAEAAAPAADAVVVAVDDLRGNAAQQALVEDLTGGSAPVLVVLAGAPYDYASVPGGAAGVIASYGTASVSYQGVAGVVSGRVPPTGRLPVEVTGPDGTVELGFGLRPPDAPPSPATTACSLVTACCRSRARAPNISAKRAFSVSVAAF